MCRAEGALDAKPTPAEPPNLSAAGTPALELRLACLITSLLR